MRGPQFYFLPALLISAPLLLLAAAYLPMATLLPPPYTYLLKTILGSACHQEPLKCAGSGSREALLCMRCTGIYAGAAAGAVAGLLLRYRLPNYVTGGAWLLLLCDVLCHNLGVYNYSFPAAFLTGLLAGGALFYAAVRGLLTTIHQEAA